MIKSVNKIPLILFSFFISILFVLFFSYSTSPLYQNIVSGDSAIFLTIGKAWSLGKLPYRDVFDHKGPLIFFVDMLGFLMGGGARYGVTVIQSLFMFISLIGIYKLSQEFKESITFGYISLILYLGLVKINYMIGNTVEEFCLPFMVWSIYGLYRFLYTHHKDSPMWGLVYGSNFAVCLLTRVTNFVPIAGLILVVIYTLIKEKRYLEFVKYIGTFMAGFLILTLPFALYFNHYGLFMDFLDGTLLFNIKYSKGMVPWIKDLNYLNINVFIKYYFSYYVVFLLVASYFKRYRTIAIGLLISAILETYVFLSGKCYMQYPLVCAHQPILLFCLLIKEYKKCNKSLFYGLLAVFVFDLFHISIKSHYELYLENKKTKPYTSILNIIPDKEKGSFITYGDSDILGVYLNEDLMPLYKFFVLQQWHGSFSKEKSDAIYKTFNEGNAMWLLAEGDTSYIDEVLQERYILKAENNELKLYRLK